MGTRLVATGGLVSAIEDVARQNGTTVVVRSLFFNTPARRKFLRSARSETRAAVEAVTALALALPGLGVSMLSDGKQVIEALPAPSLAERAAQLLGRRFAATLLSVGYEAGGVTITGLVQRPAEASPTGRAAYLFVNGRPFRDPFLVRAAERGYRATVPAGSRPSVILALEVPAGDVDVNVHPAKLEVRFRDRYGLEAAVEEAVHRALGDLVSAAPLGGAGSGPMPWEHQAVSASYPSPSHGSAPVLPGFEAGETEEDEAGGEGDAAPAAPLEAGESSAAAAPSRILGQVHATYILVEAPDGLLIVDQHSAHERILYERAMRALTAQGDGAQKLLFPLTLQLTPDELDAVEAHADLLARLGYEIEGFGGASLIVHAVPAPHARFDAERCLRDVVTDLAGGRFGGLANPLERFASTFACRAAIKAGQALTEQEMRELVDRLFASELPAHDVHGRPTIVQLPRAELERRFGRR